MARKAQKPSSRTGGSCSSGRATTNRPRAWNGRVTARPDDTTFVDIANFGFSGSTEEQAKQAIDSTERFAFVVASLKALLEHDMKLDLVADRFPDGLKH